MTPLASERKARALALDTDRPVPDREPAHRIFLWGDALIRNDWVIETLEGRSGEIELHTSLNEIGRRLAAEARSIVLLESTARGGEPLELVRGLDEATRGRVLLVIWRAPWSTTRQFVDAGVGDILRLPSTPSELLARVDLRCREMNRLALESGGWGRALTGLIDWRAGGGAPVRLTERESRLFELLAGQLGAVVSRGVMLERIWGRERNDVSSNIVDVYVRYLRVKLARVAPGLCIRTVKGTGYVLERS